jgi:hypothetical protein
MNILCLCNADLRPVSLYPAGIYPACLCTVIFCLVRLYPTPLSCPHVSCTPRLVRLSTAELDPVCMQFRVLSACILQTCALSACILQTCVLSACPCSTMSFSDFFSLPVFIFLVVSYFSSRHPASLCLLSCTVRPACL